MADLPKDMEALEKQDQKPRPPYPATGIPATGRPGAQMTVAGLQELPSKMVFMSHLRKLALLVYTHMLFVNQNG